MRLDPGTTLGRYRLLAPLGAGGMGAVWRAHDAHLDREVAIKLLAQGALSDPATRERFRREAHVLASLAHPGVATIFDFDAQDGVDYIVMELVLGGSLEGRLETGAMDAMLLHIDGDAEVGMSTDFTAHGSGKVDFSFNTSASWNGANPGSTFSLKPPQT